MFWSSSKQAHARHLVHNNTLGRVAFYENLPEWCPSDDKIPVQKLTHFYCQKFQNVLDQPKVEANSVRTRLDDCLLVIRPGNIPIEVRV